MRRFEWRGAVAAAATVLAAASCTSRRLPEPGSTAYEDASRAFYRGLAELQVGLLDDAKRDFLKAADLAPAEPAAWANLALSHLRLGEFDAASAPVDKAVSLQPTSADLVFLRGRLKASAGKLDEGMADYRRAAELDATNVRVRFALAEEVERAGGPAADTEAQQLVDAVLKAFPGATIEAVRGIDAVPVDVGASGRPDVVPGETIIEDDLPGDDNNEDA